MYRFNKAPTIYRSALKRRAAETCIGNIRRRVGRSLHNTRRPRRFQCNLWNKAFWPRLSYIIACCYNGYEWQGKPLCQKKTLITKTCASFCNLFLVVSVQCVWPYSANEGDAVCKAKWSQKQQSYSCLTGIKCVVSIPSKALFPSQRKGHDDDHDDHDEVFFP